MTVVRTTFASESTGLKARLPINYSSRNVLDQGFCFELEKYRPSELGSKIFRSKRSELRKKLGGAYERETFF